MQPATDVPPPGEPQQETKIEDDGISISFQGNRDELQGSSSSLVTSAHDIISLFLSLSSIMLRGHIDW